MKPQRHTGVKMHDVTSGLMLKITAKTKKGTAVFAAVAPMVNKRIYLKSFSDFDVIGYKTIDNRKRLEEVEKTYIPAWHKYKKEKAKYDLLEPWEKAQIPEEEKPHPPAHPFEKHLIYFDYDKKYFIFCDKMTESDAEVFHQHEPKEYAADDAGRVARITMSILDTAPITEKDVVELLESTFAMDGDSPVKGEGWVQRGRQQVKGTVNIRCSDIARKVLSPDEVDQLYKLQDDISETQRNLPVAQQKWGIPLFMYATTPLVKKFIDGVVNLIAGKQKGPSEERMEFDDVYSTDLSRYLITQDFADRYKSLSEKVQEELRKLRNLKPEDCPKIPHVNKKFKLMPHQAQTLAILDRMDTGLIGVQTGGGKTAILVFDILNLIHKGKVKRPLILMPTQGGRLVAQQKKEIENDLTDGMINVIGITSQSFAQLGQTPSERYSRLEELVTSSPPNTIFLSTYDWIKGSKEDNKNLRKIMDLKGTKHDFERVYWLMSRCHVDYVALDESHKIKNVGAQRTAAAMAFASCPYRRISTGTIVDNNPADLHQQVSFLDPMIFGDRDQFLANYAGDVANGQNGSVAVSWRRNAAMELRQKLLDNGASLVDRSHWLHMLPKLVGPTIHVARMSSAQHSAYREIFEGYLSDIEREANEQEPDPKNPGQMRWKNKQLHDAWEKLQSSATPDDEEVEEDNKAYEHILGKLSVIDSFLNSPLYRPPSEDDPHPRWNVRDPRNPERVIKIDKLLTGEDRVSPKCKVIDGILDQHFADRSNGKVLILSYNKNSVMHLAENIKRAAQADYYWSGRTSVLDKFLDPDSDLKIMVATDKSVETGLNLQYVGNRIIRCGVVWTPGSMDQGFARMWRAGSDIPGKVTQFDNCYIDFVLCEESIDFTKYARFVWKEHYARQINAGFKTESEFPPIVMNMEFITGFNTHAQALPYHEHYTSMFEQEKEANAEHHKVYGNKLYPVRSEEKIKGEKKIKTPTMPGEEEDDTTTVLLEVKKTAKGIWVEVVDASDVPDKILLKHKWKYDKKREVWFQIVSGDGGIKRIVSDLENEDFLVHVNDSRKSEEELDDEAKKKGVDKEDVREKEVENAERKDSEDTHIVKLELYSSDEEDGTKKMYLRIPKTKDDLPALADLKFKYHLRWFYYFIKSKSDAIRMLEKIHAKKIHIPNVEEVADLIRRQKFTMSKIKAGPGKIELVSRMPKKKARGEITVYLDWRNAKPVLTFSEKESTMDVTKLRSLGFKDVDPPMYWKFFRSQSELIVLLKKMREEGIKVSNWDAFTLGLKRWKLSIPSSLDLSPGDEGEELDVSKARPER